jgi:hypothetical protein
MGSGMNSGVSALAVDGSGQVIAGGSFTTAGGTSANRIAKWDGTSWSALGLGMNGPILALAIDGSSQVIAGGSFTTAGGTSANYIAKWDGTSWSAMGLGMYSWVEALAINGSGQVIAGGAFTTAGGTSANYIAKWDGTNWSALPGNYWSALPGDLNRIVSAIIKTTAEEHIVFAGGTAIFSERTAIGLLRSSQIAGDTADGDVHLVGVDSITSNPVYMRWDDASSQWQAAVTLESSNPTERVDVTFQPTTGLGAALWRGNDSKLYKKDFNSSGVVATSADQVAPSWTGDFLVSKMVNGNTFTLFGRTVDWLLRREVFSVSPP